MIACRHDTAVVVLSYNGRDLHRDFFPELIKESANQYDVILIDNASTNDTADFVRTHFPEVQIISLTINRGFANGYYEGLKQIQAKYFVLLSADFEITPGWFEPMFRMMEKHPDIGACQPKIKYYRDKSMFEYAGAGGGFLDGYGYLFCRGRIFETLEPDEHQYDNSIGCFWAGGGCFFTRSDAYFGAGELDRDLYAHMEEVDLCWRMKNMGYRIAYCGASTVYHIGGSVISYGSPQKIFYNYRNSLILLFKNLPLRNLIWLLPFRLVLDGISGIRAFLKGNHAEWKSIIRAHGSFYRHLGLWYKKRRANKVKKSLQSLEGVYPGSIVWQYFIRKTRYFHQLAFPTHTIEAP
ncbi:MAG TPA: glycosyltransferase family 2 protein [Chitinophagaceae bacterium]|nr:glycosyltransferase family 2 protein [Chitinophagaceae bacterium]HNF72327.1 glycosyltransferase family 2 protein [Chitinophagaceae bacterium]